MRVEGDFFGPRQSARQCGKNHFCPQFGQSKPDRAAGNAEQRALYQQLANHADGAGSQRGTDGELAGATGGARKKQVGHVGTSDQQDKTDCAEQDQQDSAHIADHIRFERNQRNAGAFIGFGISGREVFRNARHIRARLFDANA